MKYFYSHLIEIDSLLIELEEMELSSGEKKYLAKLADETLHHAILDAIFSRLSEQEKIIFVEHLRENDHDKIWQLLNSRIDQVEDEIKKTSEKVKADLHQDLKAAKKLK